jgi:hypothetical protein
VSLATETKRKLDEDVDSLFKLPLAEFTGARNALAARLKQAGRGNDANLVKALAKPSISAWAVNQLYWNHREPFDGLLAAGERIRQGQGSGRARKVTDMRGSLETRRKALSHLSDLATSLLIDAGHSPTSDTIRRITTTLEALSAHASLSDGPTPGRLAQDVDPPGFESLASLMLGGAGLMKANERLTRVPPTRKSGTLTANQKAAPARIARELEEDDDKERIAAAKASLQTAKKSLTDAKARAQRLEVAQKKAYAEAKEAEKLRHEAEVRFKRVTATAEVAADRARTTADEAREATDAAEDARREFEEASKELESLLRE